MPIHGASITVIKTPDHSDIVPGCRSTASAMSGKTAGSKAEALPYVLSVVYPSSKLKTHYSSSGVDSAIAQICDLTAKARIPHLRGK